MITVIPASEESLRVLAYSRAMKRAEHDLIKRMSTKRGVLRELQHWLTAPEMNHADRDKRTFVPIRSYTELEQYEEISRAIILEQIGVDPLSWRACRDIANYPELSAEKRRGILEQRRDYKRRVALYLRPVNTLARYQAYLRSPQWHSKRIAVLKQWHGRCALNSAHAACNIHHRTYERIGDEPLTDLVPLCRACHAKFHNVVGEPFQGSLPFQSSTPTGPEHN